MGWRDRTWAARTDEEIEACEKFGANDGLGPIPLWEETADRLRVRLHDIAENCPPTSIPEICGLIDAANTLQMFHIRGQQLDAADPQDEDEEDDDGEDDHGRHSE